MRVEISTRPRLEDLEIPMDAWTLPFWEAAAQGELRIPQCTQCRRFRWPPGPFCSHCHSQQVAWLLAGEGRIYSFTVVRNTPADESGQMQVLAPALIEFPTAGGVRLLAAIVDTPVTAIEIGGAVELTWIQAANACVPAFKLLTTN